MTTGILQNKLILIQEESSGSKTNNGYPSFLCLVKISETGLTKFSEWSGMK